MRICLSRIALDIVEPDRQAKTILAQDVRKKVDSVEWTAHASTNNSTTAHKIELKKKDCRGVGTG
jgi:hypothetical protein